MKKEATKKSKMWVWLVAGLAVVLVAAGVLGFMLWGGDSAANSGDGDAETTLPANTETQGPRADLYWNLDRKLYTENSLSGLSTREPGEDGVYRVRYAYNGEVVELPVSDKQLINFIDTMDCMGVVLDDNGTVIDVVDPKTLATETARMFYVRKAETGKITLNSSMAMNGMNMEVLLTDVTEIYDVAPDGEKPGAKVEETTLEPMDAVTVYSNADGAVTHVFVVTHPVESPVYWRAENNMYNSSLKETKRIPDAEGYYTIGFYCEGEYVELKCNNVGIVNTIDAKNRFRAHTGLVVENGIIVDNMLAATGIRGLLGCEMYDVTEVNGNSFKAEALVTGSGDVYEGTLNPDAKIYDISLSTEPALRGKAIDGLRLGDRIAVFEDADGGVQLIYVGHRVVDAPMYFNVTKKYDSTNKCTKRTADGNGWYTIDMMSEGVIKTYKTKDKSIMDFIDSQNNRSVGLVLNGDIIERAYEGECIAGYGAIVGYTIKTVTGSILSMHPASNPDNVTNRILNMEAKVYNMSGVKQEKGATTTLQVGDYCILWRNPRSEIVYAYVIKRLVNAPVYFSLTRKWDSTKEESTRVPDADGWYIYECLLEGKKVTVKTQSKKVADFLDSQSPQTFALKVNSEGVILDYYNTENVFGGTRAYLNTYVKRLDKLVLYNPTNEKTYTPKLAKDCKIYNMSTVYEKNRGERTTLQMNDRIQCYTNSQGEIAMIMVRERKAEGEIYFSKNRIKPVDGKLVREPDADGWYVFECAKDGKLVTVKTKDADVALFLDSQSPRGFALQVGADGVIKKAYDARAVLGGSTAALNQDITAIDGRTITTFYSVDGEAHTFKLASKCKVYNVSTNYDDHWGETTTLKVNDQLQCYTNQAGEIVIAYVTVRPAESYMAWNVDPDKGNQRTPDADGLYTIQLAVGGQIQTYKATEDAVRYSDSANGALAIFVKNGVIVEAKSAIYGPGIWSSVEAAHIATLLEVNGNMAKIKTYKNEILEFPIASDFKCYDVSGEGAFKGVEATPVVGNYGRFYLNVNKEIAYCFITSHTQGNTPVVPEPEEPQVPTVKEYDNSNLVFEEGTTNAYCTYCEQTVEWTALATIEEHTTLHAGHYYLAESITGNTSYYNIAKNETVCVHLNGNNITSAGRVFAVENGSDTLLNVMGNGIVTGGYKSNATANVAGATISVRGSLNLIGGTYKHSADSTLPTIIMAKPQETMNIYKDVKIEGTEGTTGTNLYVMMGAVNMYGGEITGGTATPNGSTKGRGDNVYVHGWTGTAKARAVFNMYGGMIDGGIYAEKTTDTYELIVAGDAVITANNGGLTLDAQTDARVTLGALTENAKVYVSGQGNLTTENPKAQEYLTAGIIASADETVVLSVLNDVIVAPVGEVIPEPEEVVWVLAWVVDPQFDATNNVTTRTPDVDGYYYVELSVNGVTNTYKTKVTGLGGSGDGIDYVDQSGAKNRAVAICLTGADSLEFVKALGATSNTGAKGAAVTTVTSIVDGVITGTASDYTGKVAENGKIFDVSSSATAEGEITELKVGDYCRFYVDAEGNVLYGYVYTRVGTVEPEPEPTGLQLYWNVDRQKDDNGSTRTPDAEGWYYIDLAVNGEIKTFKTNSKKIIDYIDKGNGGATALTVEGDVITACASALEGEGVEAAGKGGTVLAIEGVKVTVKNSTEGELNVNMASDVKVYDVSGKSEFIGQASELKVGDSFRCYNNADGEMLYIYILTRTEAPVNPEPEPEQPEVPAADLNDVCAKADAMVSVFANGGEVEAECPACGKTVTWKPMPAISGATKLEAGHYYFESDVEVSAGYYSINDDDKNTNCEVCIHLNGKTFQNTGTGNTRSFYVDSGDKLTIMGSGNIIGARGAHATVYRCGSTLEAVGSDTVVNICGGTWSKTNDALDVMGGRLRGNGALNIYNGTVINIGEVQGNALWAAGGKVNLFGGEINGDVQVMKYAKDTATLSYPVELNLNGTVVNGKVHYNTENGIEIQTVLMGTPVIEELAVDAALPLQIGRLVIGANVKITASGVFTKENPNLQDYVDAGFLTAKEEGKIITVTDGVASIADATPGYDNSNLVFEAGTNRAYCTYCGDVKEWTVLEKADGSKSLANGGHFYFAADQIENTGRYNVPTEATVCVHLNGHNVTNTANRAFSIQKDAKLTIMGNGIVTGSCDTKSTGNAAAATISSAGELVLVGGTYRSAAGITNPTILQARAQKSTIAYEGAIIEGTADNSAMQVAYGNFVLNGGTVTGGKLEIVGKDVTGTAARAAAVLNGGTVNGGISLAVRDPNAADATYELSVTVNGDVKVTADNGGITLAQGAVLTLGQLTAGAEVAVTAANGAITAENAKAAEYLALGYIKAAEETKTVTEKDGILSIG